LKRSRLTPPIETVSPSSSPRRPWTGAPSANPPRADPQPTSAGTSTNSPRAGQSLSMK
jgi:hypothetical protein